MGRTLFQKEGQILMTAEHGQRGILLFFMSLLLIVGAILVIFGSYLAMLGGSAYYVIAGYLICAAAFYLRRNSSKSLLFFLMLSFGTIIWSVFEVGWNIWHLIPRISLVPLIGLLYFIPAISRAIGASRCMQIMNWVSMAAAAAVLGSAAYSTVQSQGRTSVASAPFLASDKSDTPFGQSQWSHWGGSLAGNKFSPSSQIDAKNVGRLAPAWTFDATNLSGLDRTLSSQLTMQTTPLHIGGSLYFCLGNNVVIALDQDSGSLQWTFDPKVNLQGSPAMICRGLAYHLDERVGLTSCPEKIVMATIDDRLIALDRRTGAMCDRFGIRGSVNLAANMGNVTLGTHYVTSPPTVVGDTIVVGSRVLDGRSTDMPSGAVRGYDARNGQLLWVWDALQPKGRAGVKPDEIFRRSGPNAWSVFSADVELGLVYLPIGGSAIDHFGGNRPQERDRYGSSIVALDVKTGDVRWSFQTVHHDIWDYDVASQPVVTNLTRQGTVVPALIAPTKRGEIFVLDRRNGKPIFRVEERNVPSQSDARGERLAETQPYSTGFHSFNPATLREADMWGATPFDLLYCRIKFRGLKYEGEFTPPSPSGSIIYPAVTGVMNWGGISVDPIRHILVATTNNLVTNVRLIERKAADTSAMTAASAAHTSPLLGAMYPQVGTPYAATAPVFTSPLGFPCNAPPWGRLSAVDLQTGKLLWTLPLGTTRDVAPLGIALPTGIMGQGGSMVTAGGLTFVGASFESVFRAFETHSGKEVWQSSLPAPGRAIPMSYTSTRTGTQFIVVAAGGASRANGSSGNYIVAFALPGKK